jgi:protein-tyrosine phosphatase
MPSSVPYWIESGTKGRLAILPRPRGGDWLADEVRDWARAGIDVVVSLLTPDEAADLDLSAEADQARAGGVEFIALAVPDRGVPESRQAVAELVAALAGAVREGKDVGFHCRQGIGRSALLAAGVLVALGETPDAALERVSTARGLPVPETAEQQRWLESFARFLAASRPAPAESPAG